jgi:hypothetical protein
MTVAVKIHGQNVGMSVIATEGPTFFVPAGQFGTMNVLAGAHEPDERAVIQLGLRECASA